MPSPIAIPTPETMARKTLIIYIIAVLIAALMIGFFAALLIDIRALTFNSRFEIYVGLVLMVVIISVGLLIHHLSRGLRKAI